MTSAGKCLRRAWARQASRLAWVRTPRRLAAGSAIRWVSVNCSNRIKGTISLPRILLDLARRGGGGCQKGECRRISDVESFDLAHGFAVRLPARRVAAGAGAVAPAARADGARPARPHADLPRAGPVH